jgi:hypothetical protein
MFDNEPKSEEQRALDIGADFNDHFPTMMELAQCAGALMTKGAERDRVVKRQRDIDEVKSFLPPKYIQKYNLI